MDNLARDSIAAAAAGMSYGKWKALQEHKPNKPKEEENLCADGNKICEYCGEEFTPSRKTQRFCCDRCYHKAYYRKRSASV